MTRLVALHLAGPAEPWAKLGLDIVGNEARVSSVRLVFGHEGRGIAAWEFEADDPDSRASAIDGLATRWSVPPTVAMVESLPSIDHVVVMTDDLERTCAAIELATALPLKRIREAGGGRRQGFFRAGEPVLEVVGPVGSGSHLWGLVLTVDDLSAVCDRLGPDVVGLPKAAVQPGRFIATVRSEVGLGCAVALISR